MVGSGTLEAFDPRALAAYRAGCNEPSRIHAFCEDYRAGATVDVARRGGPLGRDANRLPGPCGLQRVLSHRRRPRRRSPSGSEPSRRKQLERRWRRDISWRRRTQGRPSRRCAGSYASASCGKVDTGSPLDDALLKRKSIGWIPKWGPLLGPMHPCGKVDPFPRRTMRCSRESIGWIPKVRVHPML